MHIEKYPYKSIYIPQFMYCKPHVARTQDKFAHNRNAWAGLIQSWYLPQQRNQTVKMTNTM